MVLRHDDSTINIVMVIIIIIIAATASRNSSFSYYINYKFLQDNGELQNANMHSVRAGVKS